MGVFDAIPADGSSITATELAQKLNTDKNLLGELSQNCAHRSNYCGLEF